MKPRVIRGLSDPSWSPTQNQIVLSCEYDMARHSICQYLYMAIYMALFFVTLRITGYKSAGSLKSAFIQLFGYFIMTSVA